MDVDDAGQDMVSAAIDTQALGGRRVDDPTLGDVQVGSFEGPSSVRIWPPCRLIDVGMVPSLTSGIKSAFSRLLGVA